MPDAITTHAPERQPLRDAHRTRVPSRNPLLPWDLFLYGAERTPEAWAEATLTAHYFRMGHRYAITPTRAEAFELMALTGFPVIPHARVGDERFQNPVFDEVVVYTSDYGGHVGMDKQRCSRAQALTDWPGALCSAFVGAHAGLSFRLLKVGTVSLCIRMNSDGDWRSNVGAGHAEWHPEPIRADLGDTLETLLGPLWAVDFVQDSSGALWAVDFNTTPGVTGIDALLSYRAFGPEGLVGPISEWFARHPLPLPEAT